MEDGGEVHGAGAQKGMRRRPAVGTEGTAALTWVGHGVWKRERGCGFAGLRRGVVALLDHIAAEAVLCDLARWPRRAAGVTGPGYETKLERRGLRVDGRWAVRTRRCRDSALEMRRCCN